MRTPQGPKVERFTLSNGLKVLIVPEKGQPLMDMKLFLPAGSAFQGEDEAAVAKAAADLLTSGVPGKDAASIEEAVRSLGYDIDTDAGSRGRHRDAEGFAD